MDDPLEPRPVDLTELGVWALAPLAPLPDLVLPDADVASVVVGPVQVSKRVWWDTADLRLTAAGVAVVVDEDGWTLTTPGSSLTGKASRGVPQGAIDLLLARLGESAVGPVATVRVEVVPHLLTNVDGAVVALAEDVSVSVLEGRRIAAKHRQLVLRGTDGSTARALLDVLSLAGLEPSDLRANLALALGSRAEPVVVHTGLTPASPAADVLTVALRAGHERLLEADLLVRLGKAKGLRKVRVAMRRLRSDLETFAPLLAEQPTDLLTELGELSRVLGAARDLQVHRQRLQLPGDPLLPLPAADVAALDALLASQEDAAQAVAAAALLEPSYFALVGRVGELATSPPLAPAASGPAAEVLPPLAATAWKHLAKEVRKLEALGEDESWHDVRKRCKQVRYACDVAAPALGEEPLVTSAEVARAQELLGEHQDAATTASVLLALDFGEDLGVSVGRLVERERARVLVVRSTFPDLWAEVSGKHVTAWFRS